MAVEGGVGAAAGASGVGVSMAPGGVVAGPERNAPWDGVKLGA